MYMRVYIYIYMYIYVYICMYVYIYIYISIGDTSSYTQGYWLALPPPPNPPLHCKMCASDY